ncbi:MAG: DUF4249 family protein [Flavobacteriales bacterium]|nr:DUF4249 family protein [Flavobacteriales bacterium]
MISGTINAICEIILGLDYLISRQDPRKMISTKRFIPLYLLLILAISFSSCEKEITVDLPTTPPRIVVEGRIEPGTPPIVLLSWSQGYFEPTSIEALQNLYIQDAVVVVSNGTVSDTLDLFCTQDLTGEELELAAELLGITVDQIQSLNICIYTSFNLAIWGEIGKTYSLTIDYPGHHLYGETKINELVELDSLWFEILNNDPQDSLGFAFGIISDPDTLGNAYRWYAKRINHYPAWSEHAGEQKDEAYIAPIGSVFDDEFFNGQTFEFGYFRGALTNSNKEDDNNAERGFYKLGDTIAVKGCVIDRGVFRFLSSFEDQVANQGSPFAVPYNIQSNVAGGLGVWAGYGAVYDTIICQ